MEPKKPALTSKSGSEKKSGPWRPTKRQVWWFISMVVALLTTALLIVNLYPEIWKGLLGKRILTLIALGVSVMGIIVLLAIGGTTRRWTGFRGKTVWDFLQLLIVPLLLAAIGFGFTAQQDARQQSIENQRAQAERELAEQRAQDEALQTYLDVMGELLLTEDLDPLDEDSAGQQKNRQVRTLARARSLTILERLDPERKASVIGFLYENTLLSTFGKYESPMVDLSDADLSSLSLRGGVLNNAYLGFVDLRHADLSHASLLETDFELAHLEEADLSGTDMSGADLLGADLTDADLTDADLSGAQGITNEELDRQADTLEGATMPNGQKYEDWVKSRDRGEGGKNDGSS